MPRSVAQREILELPLQLAHGHDGVADETFLGQVIAEIRLCQRRLFPADKNLPRRTCKINVKLKSIDDFQPVQPRHWQRTGLATLRLRRQLVGLGTVRQFQIGAREKIGVGVGNHSPRMSLSTLRTWAAGIIRGKIARRRAAKSGSEMGLRTDASDWME